MDVERGFKIKVGCLPHAATAFPQKLSAQSMSLIISLSCCPPLQNFLKHIKLSSFTHICRKIKNVAIYTFYPESFCVKNLATWNFLNVFFWLLSDWPSSLRWRGWLCVKFLQLNWTPLLSFRMTFSKSKYDARGGWQCRNKMEWPSF